jgi:hypothetical protein
MRESSKTLEQRVIEKIKMGESKEKILRDLEKSHFAETLGLAECRRDVEEAVSSYPNYKLIQNIMRGKIVEEIDGRSIYIVNPQTRTMQSITNEKLQQLFNSKMDLSTRRYTCVFEYNPTVTQQFRQKSDGIWVFNTYVPPFWQEKLFYDSEPLPTLDTLPALYDKFFNHLVAGDVPSFNYILDWTAFGLKDKNFCILTTIGLSGAGKGKFGEILEALHGKSNFNKTGNNLLTKDFNGQVSNKRLVYINEASVKDQSQEERVKALTDVSIQIEKKGKDAYDACNYANFYFSSNFLDAIKIPANDRRFSIINLTNKVLQDVMSGDQIDALTKPENIEQLALYLMSRQVEKKNMIVPHRSARTEDVREASLSAWQEWFLDDYAVDNAGKIKKLRDISADVQDIFGAKFRPSKTAFRVLESIYPNKFKISKTKIDSKEITVIVFPERDKP